MVYLSVKFLIFLGKDSLPPLHGIIIVGNLNKIHSRETFFSW